VRASRSTHGRTGADAGCGSDPSRLTGNGPADDFARRLLDWFDRHGRHDLPWQHPRTPYRVWISEVMLQQTQVATVIPYFERFVAALPTVAALAAADEDRVLALWSGLGYYRRARHLHAAARVCVARHAGDLPRDFDAVAALPGIGRSSAGAILALAHGQRHAILDGNVRRVLARFHGVRGRPGDRRFEDRLWRHAYRHTPSIRVADYTQAVMDLGATVCTRASPRCRDCPQSRGCLAYAQSLTAELPQPRAGRARPVRQIVWLVLGDRQGRILLQQRGPDGVWPRLWSLPEAVDRAAARRAAGGLAVLGRRPPIALPEVRHGFTHFSLRAAPVYWRGANGRGKAGEAPGLRWCGPEQIAALGVPAPVRKLICRLP
jgi:A/G-specific adenine glycosylase